MTSLHWPAGLVASLSGLTVTLSGTPTATGTYNVGISVTGATGFTASGTYSVTINAALALGTLAPTQWTVNQPGYNGVIPVSGGTGPISVVSYSGLPRGLGLGLTNGSGGSTITVSGTPGITGTYSNVQVTVRDASGATASGTFSITVNLPPFNGSLSNSAWTVNQPDYSGTLTVSNGTMPFSLVTQRLPPGLSAMLSGSTITTVSGTPQRHRHLERHPRRRGRLRLPDQPGLQHHHQPGHGDERADPQPVAGQPAQLPRDRHGVRRSGPTANLPPGLTAGLRGGVGSPLTIFFSGTPTTLGTYSNVQLIVQDTAGNTVSGTFTITIAPVPLITTVAGNGGQGYGGNGPATSAQLNMPFGVVVDGSGNIFIADTNNNRVREVVKATGNIVTVAGNGTAGYSGDGRAATSAQLNDPGWVALDSAGNLVISDNGNDRVRELSLASGVITTIAGVGTYGFSGDGGPATGAQLSFPQGVAVDATGNVYIADQNNDRIREVLSGSAGPQLATPSGLDPSRFSGTPQTLTGAGFQPIVTEAIRRWSAAGLSDAQVGLLREMHFQVMDLSDKVPNEVGEAFVGVVRLDATAAGYGWFVDPTPANDSEFAGGRPPAGMDLLTVVMHERGHELGLPDLDAAEHPGEVTAEGLPPGVRLARVSPYDQAPLGIASEDAVFAEWGEWTF